MKKSFLIPAIVLYVVRVAFSNNVQVGTVLFTTTDLVRRCWSDYDKSLLRARAIMQDVLPDPDCLDFSNPESIVILLDYFHTCYKIISISTYGKVQHLLFMALSDAFGGYLRAHVLPYTRKSYYAGIVKYSEAQKLFLLYDDIKSFLKTDGRGWPLPTKTPLRPFKVKPLVIKKGSEEACNLLSIIEKDEERRHMGRKGKKNLKGKEVKLSKQRRRIQRQINDYNGTVLSSRIYLKNLSPQVEDTNENEDIASFRCCKKNRKPTSLDIRGAVSLGLAGVGNKEEVRKKELRKEELCKEEFRKMDDYRKRARKQQARREEARREEASREEARKEAARKHENLKEEPLTEDPSAEDLCKTGHKEEDHKESFSIEDLFKDEEVDKEEQNEDTPKEEEQKEEPSTEETGKEEEQKEEPSREEPRKEEEQKEDHGRKETTKEEAIKEECNKQQSHTEKESKNQHHFKGGILKVHSLKKSNRTNNNTFQDDAPKESSSTETPGKEFILKEVPCKEYILQEDSRKESSSTENPYKEYVLQEDPRKEYSSTTPNTECKVEKEHHKEHSTTEVHKEYIVQENLYREYSSTAPPNTEYELEKEPPKEHSTTEISHKEYVFTENFSKEYFSKTTQNVECMMEKEPHKHLVTEIPHKEHSSTEGHYKELIFQEEPATGFSCKTECPSTENPCKEPTFEKVCSKGDPCGGVFKEDDQTEMVPEEECQTEAASKEESQTQEEEEEEENREEEVISKNTLEELPSGDEVSKEETNKQKSPNRKGGRGKYRKHKSHNKKHRKQGVPEVKQQESGFKKTVIVPLPVLDDYDCPTSIALPFRQRPLRNLKAASSAFILVNYYITVIKCFIAKGNRKRDIKNFNGQFQRWLTSKVLPLLADEQWYPGFGGVLRVLETIKVFGADKSDKYKGEEREDTEFLFNEGAEFSVDSSFGTKVTFKHRGLFEAIKADPMSGYMYAFISIFSAVVFLMLCACLCYCRRGPSPDDERDMNYQENPEIDPNYGHLKPIVDQGGNLVYKEGKTNPYTYDDTPYVDPHSKKGDEVWSFGDARGMQHHQQHEAHFMTKHSKFPTEPRLLHNVHTLWKKPSNLMNRYWTSDETKCYKTEMRTMTCNCTESCHCTVVTDSSAVTKAKTRKSSTVTFFEADDDVAHPRRNTSTRSSTQYSTTESGSENLSSSEYSESSKSLRKHRNSTHYP